MKTYNEFLAEAAEQTRAPGGYIWIEEDEAGGDAGSYKVTADKGNKRVTLKDGMGYTAARTFATSEMRKILVANPDNKFAAKVFRRKGNKLVDPFA